MTVLRGPADADHYRVPVGRYNDRHYTDPLPSCPIAEASDWVGPSWSIVKGAAGKDWSYVTNKRNGHTSTAELQRIALLEPDARTAAYNAINKAGLAQAQGRGQIVHLWAEDFLAGRGPRIITDPILFSLKLPRAALDEATEYLEALAAFFDHYQPQVIAAEYVALHRDLNGHGYGCTPDVVARIQGQTVGIDWKTRGADSDHGAYPEDAAQIAAGANAQYIIIAHPFTGEPMRAYLPVIDAGIVVSIRPDGCRIYPVDLAPAWEHVQAMHAFWVARLTEKAAIGRQWAPTHIDYGPAHKGTKWTTTPSKPSKSSKTASSTRGTNTTSSRLDAPTSHTATGTTSTDGTPTTQIASSTTTIPSSPSAPPDDLWNSTPSPGTNTPTSSTEATTPTPTAYSATTPTTATASSTPSSSNDHPTDDLTYTSHLLAYAMLDWPKKVVDELLEWWPAGCPTPQQVRNGVAIWSEAQIDHIEKMCDLADAPFWQHTEPQTRAR